MSKKKYMKKRVEQTQSAVSHIIFTTTTNHFFFWSLLVTEMIALVEQVDWRVSTLDLKG